MVRRLCGGSTLKNVVLVTNAWGETSSDIGEACQEELSSTIFKPALEKGAKMARHHDTVQSAHDIFRMIMADHSVTLPTKLELVGGQKDIADVASRKATNSSPSERRLTAVPSVRIACVSGTKLPC